MKRLLFLAILLAGCARATMGESVRFLAGEELAGRMTGSEGEAKAAEYILGAWPSGGAFGPLLADGYRQTFTFRREGRDVTGTNLAGRVKGTEREWDLVVIGAHYDHLGKGHPGADDNASGTAVLIELAHRFAARPAKRTVVFAAFSGEELGILGSKHFVARLPTTYSTVAMLNMDMVGRLRENKLTVLGTDTSDAWPAILNDAGGGLVLGMGKGGIGPSDHTAFYLKDIPVLHFFTGSHLDYHNAGDTADKVNLEGMEKVADLVEAVARAVANRADRLPFHKSDADFVPKASEPPPAGAPPYLGAMPEYGDPSIMVVEAAVPGSPADKAGIKAKDQFLELDGRKIESLQDYSDRLRAHRAGDEITLKILRDGKELTVKVTLGARKRQD
jgi:hypothetical protein